MVVRTLEELEEYVGILVMFKVNVRNLYLKDFPILRKYGNSLKNLDTTYYQEGNVTTWSSISEEQKWWWPFLKHEGFGYNRAEGYFLFSDENSTMNQPTWKKIMTFVRILKKKGYLS